MISHTHGLGLDHESTSLYLGGNAKRLLGF
jgi:hypothetical protein